MLRETEERRSTAIHSIYGTMVTPSDPKTPGAKPGEKEFATISSFDLLASRKQLIIQHGGSSTGFSSPATTNSF